MIGLTYKGIDTYVKVGYYANRRVYIELINMNTHMPELNATIHIPGKALKLDEVVINESYENLLQTLLNAKVVKRMFPIVEVYHRPSGKFYNAYRLCFDPEEYIENFKIIK